MKGHGGTVSETRYHSSNVDRRPPINDAGLKSEQIRKTPPVEGNRGHLRTADHLAHLRAGGLHLDYIFSDRHLFGPVGEFQRHVLCKSAIDVNCKAGFVLRLETLCLEMEVIVSDWQARESVDAPVACLGLGLNTLGFIGSRHRCANYYQASRVPERTGNATSDSGQEHRAGREKSHDRPNQNVGPPSFGDAAIILRPSASTTSLAAATCTSSFAR